MRVLLNGIPNGPMKHGRGLQQGKEIPSQALTLLFVVAMDPL